MERDNIIQIVTMIIAIVALILAVFAVAVPEDDEDTDDSENEAPTAIIITTSTSVEVGEYMGFDGSTSTDPEGQIMQWIWEFGDGILDEGVYSKHIYSAQGTYEVTLTVIDEGGEMDTVSTNITILPNSPPEAVIIMDEISFNVGENAYFNGSGSSDSDGRIVEWTWDFGDGTKNSGIHSNHIFQEEGVFSVTLTVIDDDGASDSDSIDVTIVETGVLPDNDPPVAVISASDTQIEMDHTIYFDGYQSTDPDGLIVIYRWDFGDGFLDDGMYATHIYQNPGTYNVTLTVYDLDGGNDSSVISITVIPDVPTGALSFTENTYGNYTGGIISLSSQLLISDASITIIDASTSINASHDPVQSGVPIQAGFGLKLTFTDSNANQKIDAGDVWVINNGSHNDVIRLIHAPTGETVAEYYIYKPAPTGVLSFTENTPGNYTGGIVSLSDEVMLFDASITIIDVSISASASQDPIQSGTPLQAGTGLTSTYTDINGNGKLDAGDVWTISDGAAGDVIKLIYDPTGQSIAEYALA